MSDERNHRIEVKIDSIKESIHDINTTLAAQHVSLKEHMRRTALLEKQIEPIQTHVNKVNGALKLLASGGVIIALLRFLS